ncbi:MAG: MATE family efflux transporter, partial [Gemmatimonadota bacterium]|nr:MATE family efflux transporter [Gemmatimonadota bacterium]
GLIFTFGGIFQAVGNTLPSLVAGATRLVTFAIPAIWLTTWSGFELRHLWLLSVATVIVQTLVSWGLLRREFGKKLVEVDG